ncbi:MAG: fructose bisphosphate aldolase [Micropruina sp.]
MSEEQTTKMRSGKGFVAALDQSGGSTPKALRLYGIPESGYSGDAAMFDLVHQMRERIMTSPSFSGEHILAAILFEHTMDREVAGLPTADYLWQVKRILPILKVDRGLADAADGVRLMKPLKDLENLLGRAVEKHIFGTKMRSVIASANPAGIAANVEQQFAYAERISATGLVPILEPEIDISAPDKGECERLLLAELLPRLADVPADRPIMFKLTIPDVDDLYAELIAHPAVLRVVALSGGYSRAEACERLSRNHGLIASFSRALTEGLTAQQTEAEFDAALADSIAAIYAASIT